MNKDEQPPQENSQNKKDDSEKEGLLSTLVGAENRFRLYVEKQLTQT
jgi:hypothetical protein